MPSFSSLGWKPLPRAALFAWTLFYLFFLLYIAANSDGFLFVDQVNLVIHEAGHLLFGWFGPTLGLWGGTLLQLMVPAALAIYFAQGEDLAGAVFSTFFFFENLLYISDYMADARVQALPLVTVGDPEMGVHDWFAIFSSLGVLTHDMQIAEFCPRFRMVRDAGEHCQLMVLLAPGSWTRWLTPQLHLGTHFRSARVSTGDIIILRANETALIQRSNPGGGARYGARLLYKIVN